ncbi:MAG TPA: hypothetical protein VID76_09885 [Solirubrobacterales bacterium]|jgi:isoprenylcysteine carboxyl methyltransferase (ICMT) family protein YpbQ
MKKRAGGTRGARVWLVAAVAATLCLGVAGIAVANNLDRNTAQNAARFAAKKQCQRTQGCPPGQYGTTNVNLITHHKAVAKIFYRVVRGPNTYVCRQQVVITLNHENGAIRFNFSRRRCSLV